MGTEQRPTYIDRLEAETLTATEFDRAMIELKQFATTDIAAIRTLKDFELHADTFITNLRCVVSGVGTDNPIPYNYEDVLAGQTVKGGNREWIFSGPVDDHSILLRFTKDTVTLFAYNLIQGTKIGLYSASLWIDREHVQDNPTFVLDRAFDWRDMTGGRAGNPKHYPIRRGNSRFVQPGFSQTLQKLVLELMQAVNDPEQKEADAFASILASLAEAADVPEEER